MIWLAFDAVIAAARLGETMRDPETQQAIARTVAKGAVLVGKEIVKEVLGGGK